MGGAFIHVYTYIKNNKGAMNLRGRWKGHRRGWGERGSGNEINIALMHKILKFSFIKI